MNLTNFQKKMDKLYAKMAQKNTLIIKKIKGFRLSFTSKMDCFSKDLPAKTSCKQLSEICLGRLLKNGKRKGGCYGLRGNFQYEHPARLRLNNLQALKKQGTGALESWLVPTIQNIMPKFFRWHATGDIQDIPHLQAICSIARKCKGTNFYIPTHYTKLLMTGCINNTLPKIPKNLQIKLSCMAGTRQEMLCLETQQAILTRQKNANIQLAYVYRTLSELDETTFWTCPVSAKGSNFKSCTQAKCRFCFFPIKGNVAYKMH